MFDVAPLVPAARPIVLEAAQIFLKHTRLWLIGLLVHGSAFKGGFIPRCSDIDMHLYLEEAAFEQDGSLSLNLAMDLHRDLSRIDTAPFQYIQAYALPPFPSQLLNKHSRHWIGPIPDTYHMVYGSLPGPEATAEQVVYHARETLARSADIPTNVAHGLLEHGGGKLERQVRFLCTDVWPTLYSMLALSTEQPMEVWTLPKEAAIALVPEHEPLGKTIRAFYQAIYAYYAGEPSVEKALQALEQGVMFLREAEQWY